MLPSTGGWPSRSCCPKLPLRSLLWPDRDEKTARHSLREAIRVIKRHAGEDIITTESDRVRLVERAVQLDTAELEDLRAQGSWQEAARLVRGEFLEGFSVPGAVDFDHWLAGERAGALVQFEGSGVTQLSGCGLADTPGAAGTDPKAVATLAAHSDEWAERFPGARADASLTGDMGKGVP